MSLRYGSTSSMLPGPPYAMIRTASCSPSMHLIHDGAHRGDLGLGKHAVPEIEDVPRTAAGPLQDVPDLARALRGRGEQRRRVEIPLDRAVAPPDARPC